METCHISQLADINLYLVSREVDHIELAFDRLFGIMDAAQVSFDLMNKTLDKSSKVKTFKAKKVLVRRNDAGPVHYDGDPIIMGTEVLVEVKEKGILVVCNREAEDVKKLSPNAVQNAVSELLNDFSDMNSSLRQQSRNMMAFNKRLWRKLTK